MCAYKHIYLIYYHLHYIFLPCVAFYIPFWPSSILLPQVRISLLFEEITRIVLLVQLLKRDPRGPGLCKSERRGFLSYTGEGLLVRACLFSLALREREREIDYIYICRKARRKNATHTIFAISLSYSLLSWCINLRARSYAHAHIHPLFYFFYPQLDPEVCVRKKGRDMFSMKMPLKSITLLRQGI